MLRDPAITLAKQADEERTAAFDLVQADGQDLALSSLFLGDAPPQVYFCERHSTSRTQLAELREDP
jgi:hypothetical protein